MDGCAQTLGADVDVDDYTLRLGGYTSVAIGHGEGNHLVVKQEISREIGIPQNKHTDFIGTSDHAWKPSLPLRLALDHCLENAGMVRTKVHEAVRHSGLYGGQCLNGRPITWTRTSHSASKKASDAVYLNSQCQYHRPHEETAASTLGKRKLRQDWGSAHMAADADTSGLKHNGRSERAQVEHLELAKKMFEGGYVKQLGVVAVTMSKV